MICKQINRRPCFIFALFSLLSPTSLRSQGSPYLSPQIAEVMSQGPSGKAHQRFLNAKGIIVQGSFQPSPDAGSISRASHLQGGIVPVTVCFSDGALDSNVADTIAATSIVADSAAAERKLAFDPTDLIDGIELSDDPLPELRSRAYVYSVAGRHAR